MHYIFFCPRHSQLRLQASSSVEDVALKLFNKPFCLRIVASPADGEKQHLFIQAASNDELCLWREAILRSISACASVAEGVTMAQQRRVSAGVTLEAAAADESLPSKADPPSWIRTGVLKRALKDVSV